MRPTILIKRLQHRPRIFIVGVVRRLERRRGHSHKSLNVDHCRGQVSVTRKMGYNFKKKVLESTGCRLPK